MVESMSLYLRGALGYTGNICENRSIVFCHCGRQAVRTMTYCFLVQ